MAEAGVLVFDHGQVQPPTEKKKPYTILLLDSLPASSRSHKTTSTRGCAFVFYARVAGFFFMKLYNHSENPSEGLASTTPCSFCHREGFGDKLTWWVDAG